MDAVKIVHVISSLKMGGAETILYELLTELKDTQIEHTVLFFYDGPYRIMLKRKGIRVIQIPKLLYTYDPFFLYSLYTTIKKLKPDYLHTVLWSAGFLGGIVGRMLSIPVIHSLHNLIGYNGIVRNVLDRLARIDYKKVIAVSKSIETSVYQEAPWIDKQKVITIQNGIDQKKVLLQAHLQQYRRQHLGLSQEHFVIGAVGRLEPVKNYGFLLTLFALLHDDCPEARLVIVGSGSQEKQLRKKAEDLSIDDRVVFVTDQQAFGYYPLFDCYISVSYSEGLSLALLEAMSCGVPAFIISQAYTHEAIVNGKTGVIISDYDIELAAHTLLYFYRHPEKRRKLALAAQKEIETNFDATVMIRKYSHVFNDLVKNKFKNYNFKKK